MTGPLGERLRVKRVVAGLSRSGLAKHSGLSECTIKLIEKGKTQPTERTLLRLLSTKELGLLLTELPETDLRRVQSYYWAKVGAYEAPLSLPEVEGKKEGEREEAEPNQCDGIEQGNDRCKQSRWCDCDPSRTS
jgi:transcriptional regulator with XRE-family HTH domain